MYPTKAKADYLYDSNQLQRVKNLPFLSWQDLPSQSSNDQTYFKEWFDYMYNNGFFESSQGYVYVAITNPNYVAMTWGFTYGRENAYSWSLFYYIKPDSNMMKFGYRDGVWFIGEA